MKGSKRNGTGTEPWRMRVLFWVFLCEEELAAEYGVKWGTEGTFRCPRA